MRAVSAALALSLIATSCASDDAPSNSGGDDGVSAGTTADAQAALTGAGVAVVDSPTPVVTDAVFTLTKSQAQFVAEEAVAGAGLLGSTLDAAGGGTTSGLPMSAVLAGYVRGVDTPGAEYSRALLSGQDLTHPEGVLFPTVVLALFAADAVSAFAADEVVDTTSTDTASTDTADASGGLKSAGFGQSRKMMAGLCSDVTKSIFDAVDSIFAKIHIPQGKVGDTGSSFLNGLLQGLTDVVVSGLNFVIDAAKTLIVDGIKFVLSQVLTIVAEVAAAAALVANFVSAVRPWTLKVTAKDPKTRKGVDSEKVYDRATATAVILGPTDDWPDWFVDCAKVAGVTLPSLLPVDAPVIWIVDSYVPSADLLTESADEIPKDTKLRKEGSEVLAKIGFVTGTESEETASKGEAQHGPVIVTATARRNQIEELRQALVTAVQNLANNILQSVPALIRNFLVGLVAQAAEGGSELVASLLDASGKALIDVLYHGPAKPETQPGTTVAPSGDGWSFAFFQGGVAPSIAGYTCNGLESTWHIIFGPGSDLERTYDLAFKPSAKTVHYDLIYDFPPAGTSGAVHVEWRWDYFLDDTVSPPMLRLSGEQHETPAGGSEYVFVNNFGTGDGIELVNTSLPKLLAGSGLSHPFLDQAQTDCG